MISDRLTGSSFLSNCGVATSAMPHENLVDSGLSSGLANGTNPLNGLRSSGPQKPAANIFVVVTNTQSGNLKLIICFCVLPVSVPMESDKYVQTTAPAPTLVGRKRYVLVPAAILVAYVCYLAFAEPLLFSIDFDKARILVASMAAFFFIGLLVWADKENDKDKLWEDVLSRHLENSDRTKLADVQLADLLPAENHELSAALDSPMASNFDSSDTPGLQIHRWVGNIVCFLGRYGALVVAMQIANFVLRWPLGGYTKSDLISGSVIVIVGFIAALPVVLIWLFNRSKPLLASTGYKKLKPTLAKHRCYAYFKYHRQVLLDHGFEELFDAQFDSTICTFFASSNRDLIVEVGIGNYGRFYFGARTVTEDGTMFHTHSGGFDPRAAKHPDSVQVNTCQSKPIETLLRKHAVALTNRLIKSKTRLVVLKDQIIDQLFLANRFRYTPMNFWK